MMITRGRELVRKLHADSERPSHQIYQLAYDDGYRDGAADADPRIVDGAYVADLLRRSGTGTIIDKYYDDLQTGSGAGTP